MRVILIIVYKVKPSLEADAPPPDDSDVRCHCGALLARLVEGGVEIKCRRCKRVVVVPLSKDDGEG